MPRTLLAWPLLVLLLATLCLPACSGQPAGEGGAAAPRLLKLSHSHPASDSSEIHFAATTFAGAVNAADQRLTVENFANNALGEEREVYEGMQLGSGAQLALTGTAILGNFAPRVGVLDLPFLWQDYDHVHRALDGEVGAALAADLEQRGLVVLAWMDSWGYRNVVVKGREITSLDDLSGLKLRTIQTPPYVAALQALGASPTPMPFGEVYTSMNTGVIDGFEHSASVVLASNFHEVADTLVRTRHLFGPLALVVSKAEWSRLSPEQQALLRASAEKARDAQRALATEREEAALEALKAHGMKIVEIDVTAARERARAVQDTLAAERNATDLLQQIRAAAR